MQYSTLNTHLNSDSTSSVLLVGQLAAMTPPDSRTLAYVQGRLNERKIWLAIMQVHAMAPAGSQAGATSEANQFLGGSIKVTPVMPAQQCASQPGQPRPDDGHVAISNRADRRSSEKKGHHSEGAAAINDSAGCTWRPAGMTATYAQGLPRRICWPLKAAER